MLTAWTVLIQGYHVSKGKHSKTMSTYNGCFLKVNLDLLFEKQPHKIK